MSTFDALLDSNSNFNFDKLNKALEKSGSNKRLNPIHLDRSVDFPTLEGYRPVYRRGNVISEKYNYVKLSPKANMVFNSIGLSALINHGWLTYSPNNVTSQEITGISGYRTVLSGPNGQTTSIPIYSYGLVTKDIGGIFHLTYQDKGLDHAEDIDLDLPGIVSDNVLLEKVITFQPLLQIPQNEIDQLRELTTHISGSESAFQTGALIVQGVIATAITAGAAYSILSTPATVVSSTAETASASSVAAPIATSTPSTLGGFGTAALVKGEALLTTIGSSYLVKKGSQLLSNLTGNKNSESSQTQESGNSISTQTQTQTNWKLYLGLGILAFLTIFLIIKGAKHGR